MKITEAVKNILLFKDMDEAEIEETIKLLGAGQRNYKAGEFIFREGDPLLYAGIVLHGCVQVITEDRHGNRDMIGHMDAPGLFAEALCFCGASEMPVSVIASEDSTVLLLRLKNTVLPEKLQSNLLAEISVKVLTLTNKIRIIQKKKTSEKLMSYLKYSARLSGSEEFDIVYSRQELADYLGVDRSAMITELRKLKAQGIIDVHGRHFRICSD